MARATTSRPLARPCTSCGRPTMRYVTAEGPKPAERCRDCARREG